MPVQTQLQQRRGTAASWTSTNPTLAAGEIGFETDTNRFKIGTGAAAWVSLPYASDVSPLTTKGDLYTFSTTNARLPVGANGETLVADSSTSTGLRYSGIAGANFLAGGSFDIWQRGTGPFTGNVAYTSDRLFTYSSTSYSLSQETSVIPTGATNAARVTITGSNGFSNHQFTLEQQDVEKLAGQTVTFSVYLRANATYNGGFAIQILSNTTGNTQTGGTWSLVAEQNHTPSTSAYTRVSVTGTIPTNAKGLTFMIAQQAVLANGSIYYFALAKAEIGAVATTWSRLGATIQGELDACKFYCQNINYSLSGKNVYNTLANGSATGATSARITLGLPSPMRVAPTSVTFTASSFVLDNVSSSPTVTGVTINQGGTDTVLLTVDCSAGTFTFKDPVIMYANNNSNANLILSAEL